MLLHLYKQLIFITVNILTTVKLLIQLAGSHIVAGSLIQTEGLRLMF